MNRVAVIGAGFAGLAAAFSARRQGRDVMLVSHGAGASDLSVGALDDLPWERLAQAASSLGQACTCGALPDDVHTFISALGIFRLPREGELAPLLATTAGVLRPARGHDRALLDLSPLENTEVLLPRGNRAGWDADSLARALSASPIARRRGVTFRAFDAQIVRYQSEWRLNDADLAMLHDNDERLDWLAARLREALNRAGGQVGAVLFGPWLGIDKPRADALTARTGLRIGEALVGAGSPAGLRFSAAGARLLTELGVALVNARVTRIALAGREHLLHLDGVAAPISSSSVVLAAGGILGGGIVYSPAEHSNAQEFSVGGTVPFKLSLNARLTLGARGQRLGITSSLQGPALDGDAWPRGGRIGILEAVGLLCDPNTMQVDDDDREGSPLHAAGDIVADRPRTVLTAVRSGLIAGGR